jgi:hypothetical protein
MQQSELLLHFIYPNEAGLRYRKKQKRWSQAPDQPQSRQTRQA